MSATSAWYDGRRICYDGALCTIRRFIEKGQIPGTKGDWLGVEWDDPTRGKHNGTYKGKKYFNCKSSAPTAASFIRPSRKADHERTILEAIKHKYVTSSSPESDVVIISGKIAQEIGFEKVSKEQSVLEDLRIVLIDQLVVSGVVPRGSSDAQIVEAQKELTQVCPNIIELDLGYNPIETWADVEKICLSLPSLRVLKLNCIRMHSLASKATRQPFANVVELHLNQCLLDPSALISILGPSETPNFPRLRTLWMSQNELHTFMMADHISSQQYRSVETLMFENNFFTSLDCLRNVLTVFPEVRHISFQSNRIEKFGDGPEKFLAGSSTICETVQSLNLSRNFIETFDFIDQIPNTLPSLTSLRISKNPVYEKAYHSTPTVNPSETNYYLTLARIPSLKTLNYTNITTREREEGEIYYLSVVENEIKALLLNCDLSELATRKQKLNSVQEQFPRYEQLCQKHDRDSVIANLSYTNRGQSTATYQSLKQPTYPAGALASRLANTTFYIPPSSATNTSSLPSSASPFTTSQNPDSTKSFTRLLPTTLPSTNIFALISRTLNLPPLQFKLIYESPELDPIRDDLTTRSQITTSNATNNNNQNPYADWGDWDVDLPLVSPIPSTTSSSPTSDTFTNNNHTLLSTNTNTNTATATSTPTITTTTTSRKPKINKSTPSNPGNIINTETKSGGVNDENNNNVRRNDNNDKYLIKDNRKWKRRETEILMGMRAWGDFLDLVDSTTVATTVATSTTAVDDDGDDAVINTKDGRSGKGNNDKKWKDVRVRVELK